jgi:hypothetical protein
VAAVEVDVEVEREAVAQPEEEMLSLQCLRAQHPGERRKLPTVHVEVEQALAAAARLRRLPQISQRIAAFS